MKKIVLTGGGTGGHIFPNLSLIPYLKNDFEVFYIGNKNSLEESLVKDLVTFFGISAPKVDRGKKLGNFFVPFKLFKSIIEAKKILKKISPNVVFSKGGYVSVPVCLAAKILKIPIVSHEADLTLGLANKVIYPVCKKMLTSFETTSQKLKKGVFTGPPIRRQIFEGNKQRAQEQTGLNPNLKTLLFIGGSTGAMSLNNIIFASLPTICQKYNIIHIVGKNKGNKKTYKNYYQTEFVSNIEDFFAMSSFVVSRAGSNTIFELLALKKPMLLIPLENSSSRGDQVKNAKYFFDNNLALTISENNLTPQTLVEKIEELNKKKNSLVNQMNSFKNIIGNENIVKEILKASK